MALSPEQQTFYSELQSLEQRFDQTPPVLELTVRDPAMGVEGYVVVWNTAIAARGPLGPCGKGGTRITPQVDLNEIKMLARIMALKNSAAGLPLGGAKSGLRADPNAPDFEKRYRRFVSLVKPVLRENGGVFGGFGFDIGGKPEHALWACDELQSLRSFTGKPVEMGGTDYDREGIAGLGVVVAAEASLAATGRTLNGVTIAIQGIGAMGAAIARYGAERGAVISFIADPRIGGTFDLRTLPSTHELIAAIAIQDIASISSQLAAAGLKPQPLNDILFSEVEILFPAAVQDVVTEANQSLIKAKMIVEGANNPTSAAARTALFQRGVLLIPDFIANPGGIIAAFVELSSAISAEENARTRKNVTDAKALTERCIRENVTKILSMATTLGVEPAHVGKLFALRSIVAQ